MRYMIHSAPSRQWYVDAFLIPSMLIQGIREKDIVVRCDTEGKGNLISCMESFLWCGQHTADGTWHLQDDVIISHDFAEKTNLYNSGIVCGAVMQDWGPDYKKIGSVPVRDHWYSFQCIRIPDKIAGECGLWFFDVCSKRKDPMYQDRIRRKKHDDDFFRYFMTERHADMYVTNLVPNIVDHIDYLIGGTLINKNRKTYINRTYYWQDNNLVQELEEKINAYKKKHNIE